MAKEKKGEKEPGGKRTAYVIEGGKVVRTRPACPKCGEGVFLAEHTDRYHCGSCGYTRWKS